MAASLNTSVHPIHKFTAEVRTWIDVFFSLSLSICCLISVASAQVKRPSTGANRDIVLEISVVETQGTKPEEIDRLERNKDQLTRLVGEHKLRIIASLQVRTRIGESFTARAGERIPIQSATFPVFRPTEGAPHERPEPKELRNVNGATSVGIPQIGYESLGLSVEGNSARAADNLIELSLKIDLNGFDRSTGNLTPTFTQLSCSGKVRMKETETGILMNSTQQGGRSRTIEEIAAGSANEARNVMVIATTRPAR